MKKWTEEEIQILKKAVTDSGDDLSLAFEAAAQMTSRTTKACSLYWYKHLRKEPESYALMCYAKQRRKTSEKVPLFGVEAKKLSLWDKFLNLFK